MRHHVALLASIALGSSPMLAMAQARTNARTGEPANPRSGYADVNGLHMYYEVHGTGGTPLVLIHGGGSTIETNFGRVLPLLSRSRRVIAVEVQAHGQTHDIDRPFTFEQDADDVAALLDSLHVRRADILGFSNGGTTALQTAIRHPNKVNRLVIASSNYRRDGMQKGFWEFMEKESYADMPQPYKDAHLKIDPSEESVHVMHDRDARRMLAFKDIPDESIKAIQAPTLVVVGDKDVVRLEHALELSRALPHARLCILPGAHGNYLGEIMPPTMSDRRVAIFADLVAEFLDGRE